MKSSPHWQRIGFRAAFLTSAALHLVVAGVVLLIALLCESPSGPAQPSLDTRICDIHLDCESDTPVTATTIANPISPPSEPPLATGRPPTVTAIPGPLPSEIVGALQRSQTAAATPPVASRAQSATDPPVTTTGSAAVVGASLLHGALKPGQTVAYLLDCSGSMGEFGKFDRARAALLATLLLQPPGVRFQVIPYNGTARPLLAGSSYLSAAAMDSIRTALANLHAVGRGNPVEAVRVAASLHPDYIVWLTDAEDLAGPRFKPILAEIGKSCPVYVATVTASGISAPTRLP